MFPCKNIISCWKYCKFLNSIEIHYFNFVPKSVKQVYYLLYYRKYIYTQCIRSNKKGISNIKQQENKIIPTIVLDILLKNLNCLQSFKFCEHIERINQQLYISTGYSSNPEGLNKYYLYYSEVAMILYNYSDYMSWYRSYRDIAFLTIG